MKRWPLAYFGVALALLVAGNCALLPVILRSIPTPTPTPKVRDFWLSDLFVELSALSPQCWVYKGPIPLSYEENKGAEEALFAWFECYHPPDPPGGGMYAIYRFRDSQSAARRYRRDFLGWFPRANLITPYVTPDWMEYQSPVADQFRFACADFCGGYPEVHGKVCTSIGQYEEYISAFTFGISPPEKIADYTEFLEQMLRAVDNRMAHYLGKDVR